jgi:hypothetical protein
MTTVNVSPAEIVVPPRRAEPDTTVADVPDEVSAAVRVVCCERDEYFLVVIDGPIGGRSELVVDNSVVAIVFLH